MRPWPEPGARKEEEAMKKLFALLMALTMTVQLVTPAWADAVEEGPKKTTEAVEEVQETTEATEETEAPEETEAETEETEATEEVTEKVTEETMEEPTEETEEVLPEAGVVEDVAALEAGVVTSGTCGENLSWILTEDGVLRISGYGAMPDYSTSSVAPWYSKRTKITSVVVEPGATNVGDYAFYACLKLAEVELAEEITEIGQGAFQDCTKLKAVGIPEGVTRVQSAAFYNCTGLESVTLPEGLKNIGSQAFQNCTSLKSIVIPDSVTSLENDVFQDCSSLTSVHIGEGVTSIQSSTFSGCSSLVSVNIPESVTSIRSYAFEHCSSLKSLGIPESVGSIGGSAFSGCSSLTSVNISDGVTRIENDTFRDCSSLESVVIPESVTSIGEQAFYGCKKLASVSIPEGVTSIGYQAFYGCSGLTSVSIGEGVLSIGSYAFSGCSGLTGITIPEGVTGIGSYAFSGCSGLTSITIPEGVTSLEEETFYNCTSLESITLPEGLLSIADGREYSNTYGVFQNCTSLREVIIPDSVTSIGNKAFYGCSGLTSVSIGGSVTSIGSYAFSGCSGLTSITIPEGVTSLEKETFYNCTSLESVTLPEGLLSIADGGEYSNDYGVFENCISLKSVVVPDSVTSIGNKAFRGCSGLTSVSIGDSVTSIGSYAFSGCSSLTSITIPEGVTSLEEGTFSNCTSLEGITLPEGLLSIADRREYSNSYGVFQNCISLRKVIIPDSVTSIGSDAFSGCTGLTSVSIGDGVTSIGSYAFEGCTSLTSITIPEGVTNIGERTFYNCTALTTVGIPASVTNIGYNAFGECQNLQTVYYGGSEAEWKNISIDYNYYLPRAKFIYGRTHECTLTHLPEKAPTCTEKGNHEYYYCPICKKAAKDAEGTQLTTVEAEALPALGHSMEKHEETAATCTTLGNHTYYFCTTCKKAFLDAAGKRETTVKEQTVDALGHALVLHDTQAASCGKPGNAKYYTCRICGNSYKDYQGTQATTPEAETIPALAHLMVKTEAVAPTHTSGGNRAYYTCTRCGKLYQDPNGTRETTLEAETLPRLPGIDSGTCGDLQWLLSDDNILTISGEGRIPDYSGTNLAPWYAYHEQIKGLVLEEGVTAVGSFAFYDCGALREVQFPKTLRMVGGSSFAYCDSLRLLDLSKVPETVTEKTLDLSGLAKLAATLDGLVKPSFVWKLETVPGQESAGTLAKLEGTKLEVLRTGTFRLVCREENTGLTGYADLGAETTTVITPETEQLTSGQSLELKAVAMPFGTELTAKWTLAEESKAYAEVSDTGLLTAKAVTAPVQVTVKAEPASGEVPAEKTIWILPRTTAVGILADGSLVGETLIAELTEKTELQLSARIQPEGAKAEVTWSSSEESVATVDKTGKVLLLKPGTTEITAKSLDGSGLEAKLTLKVQYLDGAQTLTLSADVPETGLEPGMEAQLTLSGEGVFDADKIEFAIVQGSSRTATVDEEGLLTAGEVPGTVTVKALLKGDPLERSAEVTVQVIPTLVRDLKLEPQVSQSWGYALKEAGETNVYGEIAFVVNQNRTFQIGAQGKDYREQWTEVTNLTYESSDTAVAQVDAKGLVTLTAKEAGECVITVRCTDSLGTETRLHIVLRDSAPRLESTKLTLNSNLIAGVATGLAESYNNTIQSVTLHDYDKTTKRYEEAPSDSFTAEAEDGTLTVRALGVQKNGTYQLKLVVDCLGGSYDFTLQVKVANSLPKVTVKQIGKFDTFYLDSTAQLTATASGYEVERMELIGADSFRMDEDGNLFYAESYNPGDKIVTKGTLLVYVEGYQVPVEKAVTIATTKTAPKLTLNPSASAVNRTLEDPEFRVKVLWKGNALDLTDAEVKADVGFATVEAQGQYLVFRLTGTTGGTAKLSLRLPNWAQAVSLTHKVTVENKLPSVKLGTPTLKLNSLFSAQTARTSVWLTQGNLDISTMDFVPAAKEGTTTRKEGEKIALTYDPETENIEAKFKEIPKAGTYSYTYTAYLENGTALPNGTIKVTVAATAPKVKLSAASVKLNRYLAGQEKATVKVTMTGGSGYQVTDFEGMPEYMSYDADTGNLTVILPDETFTGETCNLYPIVREEESGQEVPLPTKLTLKVQTLNTSKLTVSLSAKGKLNTVDPDSAIAYTVTKVSNCLGTVESVDLVDQNGNLFQDGDPFQVDLDTSGVKPLVLLRLLPGESYATNKTYKVRFRFTVCGKEVLSSVLSVKVTQTALKVTAPKSAVYYLSQSGPLRCSLKANLPLESVALSTRTAKEFQQALGGQENLRLIGNRVEFKLTNPGALTAGKSYSVQLELTPENAAENTKPTTIKLTVKVMK